MSNARISAGLLMYRIKDGKLQVLLAHPGGPFCEKKDEDVWSIPKGEVEPGEDLLECAKREFEEESLDFYMKIMPPYLPLHLPLVYLSGLFEATLGLLLLAPRFSRLAAWGIIALLIVVFPANIYVYEHQDLLPASSTLHLLRLPLQGVFILWAYWHTRPSDASER